MSQNCSVRSVLELGTRQHGISIEPDWLADAGVGVGDAIGIDRRDGRYAERAAVLRLGDYDSQAVDYEKELKRQGGSVVVTLPAGIRTWMNAEVGAEGAPVYLSRDGGSDVLVETL
jgi:hypothetical protein